MERYIFSSVAFTEYVDVIISQIIIVYFVHICLNYPKNKSGTPYGRHMTPRDRIKTKLYVQILIKH